MVSSVALIFIFEQRFVDRFWECINPSLRSLRKFVKHNHWLAISWIIVCSCSSKPTIPVTESFPPPVAQAPTVEVVVPVEDLKALQSYVFATEDQLYGTPKLGTLGLYGDLKACQRKLSSAQYGGLGTLKWGEALDRVTEWEGETTANGNEVEKAKRFRFYKQVLQMRVNEFKSEVEQCNAELAKRKYDSEASSDVVVEEASKANLEAATIRGQLCSLVQGGVTLSDFMVNAFGRGWLLFADFQMEQNLVAAEVRDQEGKVRKNGFIFNGWKLAFADGPITLLDILSKKRDTKLQAWAYLKRASDQEVSTCLATETGKWSN